MSYGSSYFQNIHIKGDKNAFLSKRSIDKFKESIRNIRNIKNNENNENMNEMLQEIIKKYIKKGYTVNISIKENNIFFDIIQTEILSNSESSQSSESSKYSKYLELKIKDLKQKRLSNAQLNHAKEKLINNENNENNENNKIKKVIEEYEKVKKLTKNPILNPLNLDIYKNKQQYINIIKELYESFGNNNPFGNYYKLLLESLLD